MQGDEWPVLLYNAVVFVLFAAFAICVGFARYYSHRLMSAVKAVSEVAGELRIRMRGALME